MENEVDYFFEDWKMTNDKIEHFSDIVIRLRLEGISIAGVIIGAGLASFQYTSEIVFNIDKITINATSIVILLGAFYLLPILFLDMYYYKLLVDSVEHAKTIEEEKYKGKLQIISKLETPGRTTLHRVIALIIYVGVLITALVLACAVNYLPNT